MLNLIHLNAECMKQYTTMTHVCFGKSDHNGVEFKDCEKNAVKILHECNKDKLRKLPENDMNAHYFHMTPESQWSPMGLAHHKWNLRKPAHKVKWARWHYEKPREADLHRKWMHPFKKAKAQYGVDKWMMQARPYEYPEEKVTVNIVNVINNHLDDKVDKEAFSPEWELALLEKIEAKQYGMVEEYLKKEKLMTDEQQKEFLAFLKKADTELDEPYKKKEEKPAKEDKPVPEVKPVEPKKEEKPVEPKKEAVKPAEPKKEAVKPAEPKKEAVKPAEPKKEAVKPAVPEKKEEKKPVEKTKTLPFEKKVQPPHDIFANHKDLQELFFDQPEADMEMLFGTQDQSDDVEALFGDEEPSVEPFDDVEALFQD